MKFFEYDKKKAAQCQRQKCYDSVSDKERFYELVKYRAQNRRRDKRHGNTLHNLPIQKFFPVQHDDRKDSAALYRDLERFHVLRLGKPHKVGGEVEVRRRRDGKKFRKSLDNTQNKRGRGIKHHNCKS